MLISACYITKNAGDFLDYSMGSIAPYVDEIIVVDDYSTDNTLAICEKYGAKVIKGRFNGDKKRQRQKYLDAANGEWIMVVDDDEVYKAGELKWLVEWMKSDEAKKYVTVRIPFLHFWKSPNYIVEGHMWNMRLERIFRNLPKNKYILHHQVSDEKGRFLSCDSFYNQRQFYTDKIKVYHYSYLKPYEHIRGKIRYYMKRDNPNVTDDNLEEWVDKHPYFSNKLGQPRYGAEGLYVAGSHAGQIEKLVPFKGSHPTIMLSDDRFKQDFMSKALELFDGLDKYLEGANNYMESHWQFHNHLDHDRHQERIKYTAEHCIGSTVEIGCANGFSTDTMRKHNTKATFSGVEPTNWGYAEACKLYPEIDFYKAVGELLPFEDKSFDTVLVAEMIEHCADPERVADECWRVTKKRMIMTTPTVNHPDPDHKRHYSIEDMGKFMRKYGEPKWSGLTINGERASRVEDIYFQICWVDKG